MKTYKRIARVNLTIGAIAAAVGGIFLLVGALFVTSTRAAALDDQGTGTDPRIES